MLSTELAYFHSFHCYKALTEKDLKLLLRMLFPSAQSKGHHTSNSLLTHLFHLTFQKSYLMLNICKQWNYEKKRLRYW